MLQSLPHGVKISITRSITTAFEQYMAKIQWQDHRFSFEDFMQEWKEYIQSNSSWFHKVSPEIKSNPEFHEEVASKINEIIEKILTEKPTPEQIEKIEALQKQLGTDYDYSCKTEAKFYIDFLSQQLKKSGASSK
jgi:hydroxymethylpyrimidine pyrophosphatase-like HAD family hydrolase